ncbi:hypothetical protein [Novosphingobium sp.]|uniref:hypothetical protein n=1 Tax=Novosphingobium sp. TaxID=1874826 RepID=UPI00286E8AB1|nr:hypothetical protein [Novosphingobium sp.]
MQFLKSAPVQRAAFWLFWAIVIFSVVMALLPKPPEMPSDRLGDKMNHILAFAAMAGTAALAFPQVPRWRVIERLSFLGALIEVAQSIPALQRDCDFRDWVADTVAVIVVTGIAALVLRRNQ